VSASEMAVTQIHAVTFRLIPSRFPPVDLLERVASPDEFEVLYLIESLTNDRLRDQVGDIALVAKEDRLFGSGTSLIMAPFTHPPSAGKGGRFNPDFGVFYCALDFETALAETKYHRTKFFVDFNSPPTSVDMRELITDLGQDLNCIAGKQKELPALYHLEDYRAGQELGKVLKQENAWGLHYSSVRASGNCCAIFRPPALSNCRQSRHFEYAFDGKQINYVIEKSLVQ